jgi:hypothetical protein
LINKTNHGVVIDIGISDDVCILLSEFDVISVDVSNIVVISVVIVVVVVVVVVLVVASDVDGGSEKINMDSINGEKMIKVAVLRNDYD